MLESEDRWLAAHEASGMGVWDWDVSANQIYYSKIWKAMRGISEHEDGPAVAEWDDWLHPDDRAPCAAALQAHIDGVTSLYELEQRIRCLDGSYKWVLARGMV